MDFQQVFYILGIIASFLIIVYTIAFLIIIIVVIKKVQEIKRTSKEKIFNIIENVSGKMDFIPFAATIVSFILPLLKRKMRK